MNKDTTWRVARRPYGKGFSVEVREGGEGRTICTFPSYDHASDVARMENATLCANAPAVRDAALRAAAQLRHAFGNHHQTGQPIDPGLLESAIRLLEEATKP